jgi:anaerobic selenocysteine-containing dehydrogenase
MPGERRLAAFCPLCVSRCGCEAVVEDGRLIAVEPDPSHPTGKALCAKGRASPELVEASDRLLYPMRRTSPKGDSDPGWRRITWDEALDETATAMRRIADESGPEAVAFAVTTPSGTAISDAAPWIDRLINAFGSPNNCNATELCAWHRNYARAFTTGARSAHQITTMLAVYCFGATTPAPPYSRLRRKSQMPRREEPS